MGYEAQLAWKCQFTSTLFRQAMLTHKVGQTDLLFGVGAYYIIFFNPR